MIFYYWLKRRRGLLVLDAAVPGLDETDDEYVGFVADREPILRAGSEGPSSDDVLPWDDGEGLQVKLRREARNSKWRTN